MVISTQKTLVGWKAIAGYLSRDERTVMRWAASRGMPVQRVAGQARSSVYAWPDDLDAWLGGARPTDPAAEEASPPSVPDMTPVMPPPISVGPLRPISPRLVLAAIVGCAGLAAIAIRPAPWNVAPQADVTSARSAANSTSPIPTFHNARARASFLQAQFDWNLRTRDSLLRAVSEFGDAVALDPGVAASYVGIANSYLLLRQYATLPDSEAYARASAAAKIALYLDPQSMEARRALAFIAFWWNGDTAAAARLFGEALALAPRDPLTHHWLANVLVSNGEIPAAFREITLARALDPSSGSVLLDYGVIAYRAGNREESERVLRSVLDANPQNASLHSQLAAIALFEGRVRDYLSEAARAAALRRDGVQQSIIAGQAADYAQGGQSTMLQHMVEAARDHTRRTNTGFYELARVAAVSGRIVAAIDALAPACSQHEHSAIAAPGDLWLSRVVSGTTMQQLCRRPTLAEPLAKLHQAA